MRSLRNTLVSNLGLSHEWQGYLLEVELFEEKAAVSVKRTNDAEQISVHSDSDQEQVAIYDHEDNTPITVAIEKLPKIEEDFTRLRPGRYCAGLLHIR